MTTSTTPALLTMLVAWLWQGVAIALLTALALRWMTRLNAATRHAIWWFALVAVVLLPVVQIAQIFQSVATMPSAPSIKTPDAPPFASAIVLVPEISGWIAFVAIAIWLAATIAAVVRIAAGIRLLVRLRRQSRPFDADRETRLPMWMSVRRSGRRPELRVTDIARGACALGPGRPAILMSEHLLSALDDEAVDQIVMHEYAHLARFDDWSRLAQAIVTTVAGLHPAVRFISRRIDLEREAACDDLVVGRTGAAHRYAACLADVAAMSIASFDDAAVIPGAIGSHPMLCARVGRLLGPRRSLAPRLARTFCIAGVVLFAGLVFASKDAAPVVMFLDARAAGHTAALDAASLPATLSFSKLSPESPRSLRESRIGRSLEAVPLDASRKAPLASTRTRSAAKRSRRSSPPPAATAAMEHVHAAPAALLRSAQSRTFDIADSTEPLHARPLEHSFIEPVGAPYRARSPDAPAPRMAASAAVAGDAPWTGAADAGVAIGSGAKRAGLALGDFFTRAGRAIGKSF
jgi:beta-lactamase regulating signal transducer with metallopeptidase domain